MGGMGSGRRNAAPKRRRADNSFRLPAPPAWMIAEGRGVWRWPKFGLFVRFDLEGTARASLRYPTGRGWQLVGLASTPPNLGGSRYWWLCPVCARRCLKLYLPPRSDYFACRVCHSLSYESAQASRARYYNLFKPAVRLPGFTATLIREAVRERIGGFTVAPYEGVPEPPELNN